MVTQILHRFRRHAFGAAWHSNGWDVMIGHAARRSSRYSQDSRSMAYSGRMADVVVVRTKSRALPDHAEAPALLVCSQLWLVPEFDASFLGSGPPPLARTWASIR